jgi:hypothetical protein
MGMGKTGYITARIEPKLKARAARVLASVGVSTTDDHDVLAAGRSPERVTFRSAGAECGDQERDRGVGESGEAIQAEALRDDR